MVQVGDMLLERDQFESEVQGANTVRNTYRNGIHQVWNFCSFFEPASDLVFYRSEFGEVVWCRLRLPPMFAPSLAKL